MKLSTLYNKLNKAFPFEDQAEFDNSGLQVGSLEKEVNSILFTLDITKKVLEEAKKLKVDLIISHHPIIFFPLKQINYDSYYGFMVKELIENDIAVISMHTNYDVNLHGMNFQLLDTLNAENIEKHPTDPYIFYGEFDTNIQHFIDLVKRTFLRNNIRYVGPEDLKLKTIAVVGGSGGTYEIIDTVKRSGYDLLVTGDVKSSVARYAKENGVNILDVSHNVEEIFALNMYSFLENDGFDLHISKIDTDPFTFK